MLKSKRPKSRDPIARDLRTPKYRSKVITLKNKTLPRKNKHKGVDKWL